MPRSIAMQNTNRKFDVSSEWKQNNEEMENVFSFALLLLFYLANQKLLRNAQTKNATTINTHK